MIRKLPIIQSSRPRRRQRPSYVARTSRRRATRRSLRRSPPQLKRLPTSQPADAQDQPQRPLPLVSHPLSISSANLLLHQYTKLLLNLHTPRISLPLATEVALINAFWRSLIPHPWVEPWFRRHEAGILFLDSDILPYADAGVAGTLLGEFCAELLAQEDAVALHARCIEGGPFGGARGTLRSLVLQMVCHLAPTRVLDLSEIGGWMYVLTTEVAGVGELEHLIRKLIVKVEKGRSVVCFVSGMEAMERGEAKTVMSFLTGVVREMEFVVKVVVLGGNQIITEPLVDTEQLS